ncbi:MAG: hypothetical protein K1Y36_03195 [Blastocatellia bacterium]|nr:hypothetical protein [Blastocatellia bacterium]
MALLGNRVFFRYAHRFGVILGCVLLGTAGLTGLRPAQARQEPVPLEQAAGLLHSSLSLEQLGAGAQPSRQAWPESVSLLTQTGMTETPLQSNSTYVGVSRGLSVPIQQNIGFAFNVEPPDNPNVVVFGEQITPQVYPATLTHVLYPSLNSFIKDDRNNPFPSAVGARLLVSVFTTDTDADLSKANFNNLQQREFTIVKDFSSPDLIKSYNDYNEFDVSDLTISRGSFFVCMQLRSIGTSKLKADGSDFFFLADIQEPSKGFLSADSGRSFRGVGIRINNFPIDFPIAARISLPSGQALPPEIQAIKLAKDSMTVIGTNLSLTGQLSVNGTTVVPPLTARLKKNGRLKVTGTSDQLKLKTGNNEIVFSSGNLSSPSYRLKVN